MKRTLGAVLVGGAGTRFGEAKHRAHLPDGTPFLRRALQALAPGCPDVVLAGEESATAGVRALPDRMPDAGPLGGIATALAEAAARGAPGVSLLAVDLPRVSAPVMLTLLERWRAQPTPERSVVVAAGERMQPLAGVWGVGAAAGVEAELVRGSRRVVDIVESLAASGIAVVPVPGEELAVAAGHGDVLLNVNRPGELQAAAARRTPPIVAIQGWKNSGKTSVAAAVVERLVARGIRVMTLKRGHAFDLDHPGTDSARLAAAGSERTVLVGPDALVTMGTRPAEVTDDAPGLAARFLADADLVVAEGWKAHALPAIEVRRREARSTEPLGGETGSGRDRFIALVHDDLDDSAPGVPTLAHDDPTTPDRLAELIVDRVWVDPERWR